MDIKNMHEMIEKLVGCAKAEFDKKGIEQIDAEEMGKVTDMIKDLAEAQYYRTLVVAMEESEYGSDYDEEGPIEDGRRGYRGQPRSKTSGRYMSRGDGRRSNHGRRGYEEMNQMYYDDEYMRDMDRYNMGRMYYTDGGSGNSSNSGMSGGNSGATRGYSEGGSGGRYYGGESGGQMNSRSENARRGYEEAKKSDNGSPEAKKKSMEGLEHYMKELSEDMTEMVGKMDDSEKAMLKQKLQVLIQKIK